jgi:NhaP-type Na+/H+ or K+/H+ antiporter
MTLFLAFAVTLLIAVLISGLTQRTVLSVAVLFLASGFIVGLGWLGPSSRPSDQLLQHVAELALFSVLFTDGMRTGGIKELRASWRLPGRALLIGMPLTIIGIALLGHFLVRLSWSEAFLIGAALSPTDPVFVAAIFGLDSVPARLKHLLNVESGLNDGLALPVVVIMLSLATPETEHMAKIAGELGMGLALGVIIPWAGIRLEESRFFHAAGIYQPLNAFAIGLLTLAVTYRTGANSFLAAFAGGVSVASFSSQVRESFERFGELVTELLKLAAVLLFGALVAPRFFTPLSAWEYLFVGLAVFCVRPLAIWISLRGVNDLTGREVFALGWFGPKGFASVVYGLMILHAGFQHIAHLIGLAIVASIVVYSTTDILIGRLFGKNDSGEIQSIPDKRRRVA